MDAADQIPLPYRRISKVTIITNIAIPQFDKLPNPSPLQNGAGKAPQPAEYFMPTGSSVSPIVKTTTPETMEGIYLRICGIKNPRII